MNNREVDPKSAAADLCPHVEPQVDHRLSYGLLERRLETRSVSSLLKNRRMDASSVRFQLLFARTRRPSYGFSTGWQGRESQAEADLPCGWGWESCRPEGLSSRWGAE